MKLINETFKIIRNHPKLGTITLDGTIINESEYQFYYDNGFADCFFTEETPIKEEETISTKKKYKGITNTKK